MERRLSAIFAMDMVGYSKLVEANEIGTLEKHKSNLEEVIFPQIEDFNGRIFKEMGDGLLAEFRSVVDAAQCAVSIQQILRERNQEVSECDRVAYRIGINLGDIVTVGEDVHGDGVNVASRLESLADPGGICISGTAFDHLRSNVQAHYEPLGEIHVKNIERSIRAYKVLVGDNEKNAAIPKSYAARWFGFWRVAVFSTVLLLAGAVVWFWWLQIDRLDHSEASISSVEDLRKPAIAVLPFDNLSNSPEQEYFADGLADDLITDLSGVSGLVVISRTSSFAFKGLAMDVREIGKKLGADYLVEGSIRKIGDTVRIVAKLTDTISGEQLWADRYDRDLSGLFDFQESTRKHIIQSLSVKLSDREQTWLERRPTSSPEAYDLYLRGVQQESYFTREGNLASRAMFEQAVELDPSFAAAYSKLAQAYSLAHENNWTDQREAYAARAIELAEKAVRLEQNSPQAYWALSRIYSRPPFMNEEKSINAIRTAIELDPNFADGHAYLASRLTSSGSAEQALPALEKAMRSNPNFPFWYLFELGRAQFFLTRYEAAVQSLQKAVERNPAFGGQRRWLIAAYGHLGDVDSAEWEIFELEGMNAATTVSEIERLITITDPGYKKHFLDGLRKAGMSEH